MKKLLLLTGLSLSMTAATFAQGFIDFSYLLGSGITVATPSNPGSQLNGWFCGSDYSVQAYMAAGASQAEGSLAPIATCKTVFLGNATSAAGGPTANGEGLWQGGASNTGLAANSTATIQLRVWYSGGGATTYDAAVAAGVNTGKSALYNIALVDNLGAPKSMDDIGMTAFSVSGASIVPEPSTFALAGLGAAALLIFRRRK